jgi:hypothetical protein
VEGVPEGDDEDQAVQLDKNLHTLNVHEIEQELTKEYAFEKDLIKRTTDVIEQKIPEKYRGLCMKILQEIYIPEKKDKKTHAQLEKETGIPDSTIQFYDVKLKKILTDFYKTQKDIMHHVGPKFEEGQSEDIEIPSYKKYLKGHPDQQGSLKEWLQDNFKKDVPEKTLKILELAAEGLGQSEIAKLEGINISSVENALSRYFNKPQGFKAWYLKTQVNKKEGSYMGGIIQNIMASLVGTVDYDTLDKSPARDYDTLGKEAAGYTQDELNRGLYEILKDKDLLTPEEISEHKVKPVTKIVRTPEEIKKDTEQREQEKAKQVRDEKLKERGIKPPTPKVKVPLQEVKRDPYKDVPEDFKEEIKKRVKKKVDEKIETETGDKTIMRIIKRVFNPDHVRVNMKVEFSSKYNSTGGRDPEGADFKYLQYILTIRERVKGKLLVYEGKQKLTAEGKPTGEVKEKLTFDGANFDDEVVMEAIHKGIKEHVLEHGVIPEHGKFSIHYENVDHDDPTYGPEEYVGVHNFMIQHHGIYKKDEKRKEWEAKKEEHEFRKKVGPIGDYEEVQEKIAEYRMLLKREQDKETKKVLEKRLKDMEQKLKEHHALREDVLKEDWELLEDIGASIMEHYNMTKEGPSLKPQTEKKSTKGMNS